MRLEVVWTVWASFGAAGCQLLYPLDVDAGDEGGVRPPNTIVSFAGAAACEALFPFDLGDAGLDAALDVRQMLHCGPDADCPFTKPNNGCCVIAHDGEVPSAYAFECTSPGQCGTDNGGDAALNLISCDNGRQCNFELPTSMVCCLYGSPVPRSTTCLNANTTNCNDELCDPSATTPCIAHPGFACVPAQGVLANAPLGYYLCARRDAG